MGTSCTVVGTLLPDGTLRLDEPVLLRPGRVRVVLEVAEDGARAARGRPRPSPPVDAPEAAGPFSSRDMDRLLYGFAGDDAE